MLSLAVVAVAAAVLCWPAGVGRGRLTALGRGRMPAGVTGPNWVKHRCLLLVALATGFGALLAGLAGGLAAAMVIATVTARWRARRDRRAAATAAMGLSDALGVLVAELRAGAHPGDAATAAADGPADATSALVAAAAAARLGGDVPAALRSAGCAQLRSWLDRLADAWSLADRYGIPLADLLDAVRSDTE
ncbi:MAG: type II secretion system F family protein, partial [Actinomycetes bacterium]